MFNNKSSFNDLVIKKTKFYRRSLLFDMSALAGEWYWIGFTRSSTGDQSKWTASDNKPIRSSLDGWWPLYPVSGKKIEFLLNLFKIRSQLNLIQHFNFFFQQKLNKKLKLYISTYVDISFLNTFYAFNSK